LKYERVFSHGGKHPVDILRPFALSQGITIIDSSSDWPALLEEEVRKDAPPSNTIIFQELDPSSNPPKTNDFIVPIDIAIRTAKIADLVSWKEEDEILVAEIRASIKSKTSDKLPPLAIKDRFYARHIVAASVLESLETDSDIERIFVKMKKYLVDALGKVPTWSV